MSTFKLWLRWLWYGVPRVDCTWCEGSGAVDPLEWDDAAREPCRVCRGFGWHRLPWAETRKRNAR